MKSTMMMRNIANPQRTTLTHLEDADQLTTDAVEQSAPASDPGLPVHTANPRRTVLVDAPTAS